VTLALRKAALRSLGPLAVFEESSDAVVAFTEDGVCLYANESARRLYQTPDLVGRRVDDLRTRRSAAVQAAQWSRFRQDGNLTDEIEIELPGGGHSRLHFRAVADYLPGVHLAIVRPFDSADGAGRVAAAARVQAPGVLFRAAFESGPHASVIADGDRRFVLANRAARGILGVGMEELKKRKLDDFAPPEARGDLDRMWARFLERGELHGVSTLLVAHELRRAVRFSAKAGIVPGRHLTMFSVATAQRQPSELALHDGPPAEPLSPREQEVLTLLARGSNTETIGEYAGLSQDTVRTHLRNAMKKLDAHTRSHAVALAIRRREIAP
jgi:DNA-binding CsgD family transcriptional regulator/PAS domain-containing protein